MFWYEMSYYKYDKKDYRLRPWIKDGNNIPTTSDDWNIEYKKFDEDDYSEDSKP